MTGIRTGTGLFSGIDIQGLTTQLIQAERAPAARMESRIANYKAIQAGISTLEVNTLTLSTSIHTLNTASTFNNRQVTVSDPAQLSVSADATATLGNYAFQVLQTAQAEQQLSKGYANADTQTVGAGTITISQGGELAASTQLGTLNGGQGVRRGSIRITDRAGNAAVVDLSKVYSVDDVLSAINANGVANVTATADGDHIVLNDTSGSTNNNLLVQEVGSGHTAADLGILQSSASNTLTGSSIHYLTGDFTLDQLNDGIPLFQQSGADDFRVNLSDGTKINVNLDKVVSLNDLLETINSHTSNNGKLTAALDDGRLTLTDSTSGAGTFSVEDINSAQVVDGLGLSRSAVGNTITGDALLAGIGSRLLRNLRGGQGITQTGQISLTDRSGRTAVVDLTGAESLDQVLSAINSAEDSGQKLQLTAQLNDQGTGIKIVDTSGVSLSNLVIADIGGSTLASDLGISTNAAATSVDSGSLHLRHVGAGTLLSSYAPGGGAVETGSFLITDSAGNKASVSISSSVKTVADVIERINAAPVIQVHARLNDTGDGFVIEDLAGGAGTLKVDEVSGSVAADLRIAGTATIVGGSQQISSQLQTQIEVDSSDTLSSLVSKINSAGGPVTASVVRDGSSFNSYHLSLTAKKSGTAGQFVLDSGGLSLGFSTQTEAADALLQVGANVSSSFLLSSSTGQFEDVATGVNVTAKAVGSSATQVAIASDTSGVKDAVKSLVQSYNSLVDRITSLTRFDADPAKRGILQGQGIALRVQSRLDSLLTRQYFGGNHQIKSLADLGVHATAGGKLTFDETKFDSVSASSPDEIKTFFIDSSNGAAAKIDSAINAMTDSTNGIFQLEGDSFQNSIDSLQNRVDQIDAILAIRRDRIYNQFVKMEEYIGTIQSQSNALTALFSSSTSSSKVGSVSGS